MENLWAFSPCDLATANNLNAESLYKVANATYKFVKGQNRLNTVIWLSLVGSLMLIDMNHKAIENLILAKKIDELKPNENTEETEM